MKKTYILDTNVLIQNPDAIFNFEDNDVVIVDVTLEELDRLKTAPGDVGYNARHSAKNIEELRTKGDLTRGVPINDKGGTFRIELNNVHEPLPSNYDMKSPDNRIIQAAKGIMKHSSYDGYESEPVVLVSRDALVRIKAGTVNVPAQDYTADRVDEEYLQYEGRCELPVSSDVLSAFYKDGSVESPTPLKENEFVILTNPLSPSQSALGRYTNGRIVSLIHAASRPFDINLRNAGQKFAAEALLTPPESAPLVILKGAAGTAKTFLSIGCGLDQVAGIGGYDGHKYRKLLITRANVEFDRDIGALPGTEEEKISPLLRGCMDNLELLLDEKSVREGGNEEKLSDKVYEIFQRGYISAEALGFLRGRSLTNEIVLVDEAQNTTINQMVGILTRAGQGTKIVLCGDLDQIDNVRLDRHSNGLAFALKCMSGSPLAWVVGFNSDTECIRSSLARDAVKRIQEKGHSV